jgi:hypothetical protein
MKLFKNKVKAFYGHSLSELEKQINMFLDGLGNYVEVINLSHSVVDWNSGSGTKQEFRCIVLYRETYLP